VAKWLALNALPGVAVETISGANAPVKIEMTGDDDEALMKAQREADAEEKRYACFLGLAHRHSQVT
jgi:hypothetical protein